VHDSGGWIIGLGVGAIDITERVELEERYRRALAELTATIRSSPVAIALLGPDLRFRHVNRRFQALSGDPDRSLVDRPLADARELPRAVLDLPGEVLRTGVDATAVDIPVGSLFVTVSCFPVQADDGGAPIAVALFILDVSEQHRLARLEAEAEALRATADLAHKLERAQLLAGLGSWELDLVTNQLSWSGETKAIVGDPERYFGGGGELPVHPDDVARVNEFSHRLLTDGVPFADEFRLVRPDGTNVEVACTGEAIRDESGRLVRVWGTFLDVSARRASERAVEEAMHSADLARAQLEAEHQALQMFVRAMLPAVLPEIAGAELAAAYLPVVERVDIGGDWFDSFRLPDGRLALAVGDVTGHDLRAATVMGQVRNAVRAYAYEDPTPGEVLRRTDLLLSRLPELDLTTMVYGVYDPATADLTWANAGHPAPLLRHGGTVSALSDPGGVILGVFGDDVRYAEGTIRLAPGDTVLWFTDGLIDHRGCDPAEATRSLMDVLAAVDAAPDRLLAEVTERMLTDGVQEDDVCLLALQRAAAG
jgi:serine phosphatase RsbU (regulator of sigma subunit)/PAS domain-containing protein